MNVYAYVNGNTANLVDPMGLFRIFEYSTIGRYEDLFKAMRKLEEEYIERHPWEKKSDPVSYEVWKLEYIKKGLEKHIAACDHGRKNGHLDGIDERTGRYFFTELLGLVDLSHCFPHAIKSITIPKEKADFFYKRSTFMNENIQLLAGCLAWSLEKIGIIREGNRALWHSYETAYSTEDILSNCLGVVFGQIIADKTRENRLKNVDETIDMTSQFIEVIKRLQPANKGYLPINAFRHTKIYVVVHETATLITVSPEEEERRKMAKKAEAEAEERMEIIRLRNRVYGRDWDLKMKMERDRENNNGVLPDEWRRMVDEGIVDPPK